MKISPLYASKNTTLATAQVLVDSDAGSFDLEASIQFVNGNSAVEFDFSTFLFGEEGRTELHKEIGAVDLLEKHVTEFASAYRKAAAEALAYLEEVSA